MTKLAIEESNLIHLMDKTKTNYEAKLIMSRNSTKIYSYLRYPLRLVDLSQYTSTAHQIAQ